MPRTESFADKKVPESFASALHHQGYYRRTTIISGSLQAEQAEEEHPGTLADNDGPSCGMRT